MLPRRYPSFLLKLTLVGKNRKIPTPSLRFQRRRSCQASNMRCATSLSLRRISVAAAMRLPATAVPSSSLAPRMYDLRGGGKAAASSPFDMLKGRKIVPGWDGDFVDLTQTAAVGIVAGVCSRAVIGVATGVLKSCAVGGIVLYASQYSGFFKLDTAKIKRSAGAGPWQGRPPRRSREARFPDDPAGIKAPRLSTWPRTGGRRTSTARFRWCLQAPRPSWSERPAGAQRPPGGAGLS